MNDTNDILDYLGRDKLPVPLLAEFIEWCVWTQAHPALVSILRKTGLKTQTEQLENVPRDYQTLAEVTTAIGEQAHEARRQTGPLGLSTAEAASFLVQKLALAATEDDFDPEGVSFFTAQVCGWAGFAQADFSNPHGKTNAENVARDAQRETLTRLWRNYSDDNQ